MATNEGILIRLIMTLIIIIKIFVILLRMTTLTVNINNKKSEKAIKAMLDALGLSYNIEATSAREDRTLNKKERQIFDNLKQSLAEIKLHQQGKIKLRDAKQLLSEL